MKSFIMNQEALMLDDELFWKIISGIKTTNAFVKCSEPLKLDRLRGFTTKSGAF